MHRGSFGLCNFVCHRIQAELKGQIFIPKRRRFLRNLHVTLRKCVFCFQGVFCHLEKNVQDLIATISTYFRRSFFVDVFFDTPPK